MSAGPGNLLTIRGKTVLGPAGPALRNYRPTCAQESTDAKTGGPAGPAGPTLTPWEARAFAAIERAANEGARFPTADDLIEAIECESHASTVNVVSRLEQRGLIIVERYQRERRATIVATGKSTAAVRTAAPHWRERPEHLPEPLQIIRKRDLSMFQAVLVEARRERKSPAQMLAKLVAEAMAARLIQSDEARG